jgi:hypothetical protein
MKRIEVCTDPLCGRPFQVNEYAITSSSVLMGGRILCPHCGSTQEATPDSIFHTHALTREEEATYSKFISIEK